ncbi:MAG: HAMP domain-containing histidine kinase [Planctomycetes bacterium]|nr:HAMP domain-containing histidine kinase [Planctomycetota bacterium]
MRTSTRPPSFSAVASSAFETSDLNEVIREVVELMEPRAAEIGVDLRLVADESLPRISIDPEGIHRAVLNIVSNALDATAEKEGGRVEVRTKYDPQQSVACVQVLDNGVGISLEELPQLFALFSSTKGARGTGIGLPVSEKIVREHRGRIIVRSQPGEGTEFTVELPAHANHATPRERLTQDGSRSPLPPGEG